VHWAVALAKAYVRAGQMDLAEQALRSVVQTNRPTCRRGLSWRSSFWKRARRIRRGRCSSGWCRATQQPDGIGGNSRLQSAGKDDAAALRTAMMIQSLQPNSPSGYLLAGQVQQAQKDSAAARRSYEQAMAIDPGAVAPVMALTRLDVMDGQHERALARLDERLERRQGMRCCRL